MPVREGQTRSQAVRLEMQMSLSMQQGEAPPQTLEVRSVRREELTEKVISVRGTRARAVRVAYTVAEEEDKHGERITKKTLPQSGKAYVVEADEAGVASARLEGGGEMTGKERASVTKEGTFLRSKDDVRDSLVGKSMKPGDPAPFLEAGLLRAFDRDGKGARGMQVRRVAVRLQEVQKCGTSDCAVFAIEVIIFVPGRATLEMNLTGRMVIQGQGTLPLLLEIKGPLSTKQENNEGRGEGVQVSGSGTIRMEFKNRFDG